MKQMIKSARARAGLELARTADRRSAALADLAAPVYLHRVDCTAQLVVEQDGR